MQNKCVVPLLLTVPLVLTACNQKPTSIDDAKIIQNNIANKINNSETFQNVQEITIINTTNSKQESIINDGNIAKKESKSKTMFSLNANTKLIEKFQIINGNYIYHDIIHFENDHVTRFDILNKKAVTTANIKFDEKYQDWLKNEFHSLVLSYSSAIKSSLFSSENEIKIRAEKYVKDFKDSKTNFEIHPYSNNDTSLAVRLDYQIIKSTFLDEENNVNYSIKESLYHEIKDLLPTYSCNSINYESNISTLGKYNYIYYNYKSENNIEYISNIKLPNISDFK